MAESEVPQVVEWFKASESFLRPWSG